MYDIFIAIRSAKTPTLVVCNKQDLNDAHSSQEIKRLLEKELSLVCRTRANTLGSTSETEKKVTLVDSGDFKWEKHGKNVNFIECTATKSDDAESVKSAIF